MIRCGRIDSPLATGEPSGRWYNTVSRLLSFEKVVVKAAVIAAVVRTRCQWNEFFVLVKAEGAIGTGASVLPPIHAVILWTTHEFTHQAFKREPAIPLFSQLSFQTLNLLLVVFAPVKPFSNGVKHSFSDFLFHYS